MARPWSTLRQKSTEQQRERARLQQSVAIANYDRDLLIRTLQTVDAHLEEAQCGNKPKRNLTSARRQIKLILAEMDAAVHP